MWLWYGLAFSAVGLLFLICSTLNKIVRLMEDYDG